MAGDVEAALGGADACSTSAGRLLRGHRLSPTAVCLSDDDATAYSVSKDGSVLCWDLATLTRRRFDRPDAGLAREAARAQGAAYWVQPSARRGGSRDGHLACSASSDGRYLAVGGGSTLVLLYDARTGRNVGALPGHKDAVSGLSFRRGSHDLFSSSFDRSVKIWSAGSQAYVDSLFGHQQEVLCVDTRASERCLTGGADRSVRLFKVPEETQLVFRARSMVTESCAFVSGSQWVTGDQDGAVCLYTNTQKKPIQSAYRAHPLDVGHGAGNCGEACASWVTAVGSASGCDLVASGAGNGVIRLWGTQGDPGRGGITSLRGEPPPAH